MSTTPPETVCVPNPDDLFAPPIYEGLTTEAASYLIPGVYDVVTDTNDTWELVVTGENAQLRPAGSLGSDGANTHTAHRRGE